MTNDEFFKQAMAVIPSAFDLIAECGNSFIPDSIQVFEEVEKIREHEFVENEIIYNHIAGLLPINDLTIYQAGVSGFQPTLWKGSEFEQKTLKYVLLEPVESLTDQEKTRFQSIILSLVGTPYDFAGIAEQVILTTTGIWLGPKGEEAKKRLYCSEAYAYAYFILRGYFPEWWKISPEKFVESGLFRIKIS